MPNKQAAISDLAGKKLRATVMSADSLAQTVVVSILAPVLGLLGDKVSLAWPFLFTAAMLVAANRLFLADNSLAVLCSSSSEARGGGGGCSGGCGCCCRSGGGGGGRGSEGGGGGEGEKQQSGVTKYHVVE